MPSSSARLIAIAVTVAVGLIVSMPMAQASALRVGVYPATIRALAEREPVRAIYVWDNICSYHRDRRSCDRLSHHERDLMTPLLSDLPHFAFVSNPKGVIR